MILGVPASEATVLAGRPVHVRMRNRDVLLYDRDPRKGILPHVEGKVLRGRRPAAGWRDLARRAG